MRVNSHVRAGAVTAVFAFSGLLCGLVVAESSTSLWSQWGGPGRDFVTPNVALVESWPESGPKVNWRRALGKGESTIVTDGHRLFTMYRHASGQEVVVALDPRDGKTIWEHAYDAPLMSGDDERSQTSQFGDGPHSTPLVVDGTVFSLGFTGVFHAIDAESGKVRWTVDLVKKFDASFQRFGWATSPIAYRDTVILLVGGEGHGVVAFDRANGKVRWQATDFAASYSSPTIIDVSGVDHLVAVMGTHVVGMSPVDGAMLWKIPSENQFKTSIVSPIDCGSGRVFVYNGGDDSGGRLLQLSRDGDRVEMTEIWQNKKMEIGLANPVILNGRIYGDTGSKAGTLFCANLADGERLWRQRGFDGARPLVAGKSLILLQKNGTLSLASLTDDGCETRVEAKLLSDPAWSIPTLIGTTLVLRDNAEILSIDLTPAEE